MNVRFLAIVSLLFLYTAYKVTQLWPSQRLLALLFTGLLFFFMLGGMFFYRHQPLIFNAAWFRVFVWTGSIVMGLWATFVLLSLPFDLLSLFVSGYDRTLGDGFNPERRTFFRGLSMAVFGLSGGFASIGLWQAYRGPSIKQVSGGLKESHAFLDGLKIAQISDLHVGPTLRKSYVSEVVSRTNALEADLIFVTGDIADAHADSLAEHLAPLGLLKAKHGVFYVTGNHEYYWGAEDLVASLRKLGMIALINENKVVTIREKKVLIAGVTDPTGSRVPGHAPDLKKAMQTHEPVDYRIILAHRPDVSVLSEQMGADLQFSGHTHSGQFFPFSLLIGLAHQYTAGIYQRGNLTVYVNCGTGYWGPANRFGVQSEITSFTLKQTGAISA